MKKKIVFVLYSMTVGGVEKAFLNFLSALPLADLDITLILMEKKGDFLAQVPSCVKIVESEVYKHSKWIINGVPKTVFVELLKRGKILRAFGFAINSLYRKLTGDARMLYRFLLAKEPVLPGDYDLAIAYAGPSYLIDYYTSFKIHARKKIAWIHYDVEKFGFDVKMYASLYMKYEKVFTVSEEGKNHFIKKMPELAPRVETFYNVISQDLIKKMAETGDTFDVADDHIKILTVGRLSREKGQDYAIKALKIIRDRGVNVKWYFIGDGNHRATCEQLAKELGMSDSVCFLGTKTNPYPYMKDCDIYVQPSRHEGYCITLAEARVFGNPIVATDFVGAKEQLATRENALVTGFSESDMAEGILQLIKKNFPKETKTMDSHTKSEVESFLSLIS